MKLTKEDYLKVLLPNKREILILLALVAVVFLTFEFNLIYLKATQNSIFADTALQQNFRDQIDSFFAENKVANTISLVVFWSGVGLVAYSIIWSVYSFFTEAKNETEVAGGYVNQESKHEKLQRTLMQAGILAGIIALGLLSLNVTIPFFIGLWTNGILIIPAEIINGILQILAGFIGMIVNFYLFKMLIDWIELLD
ncbi:hypothetical protein LBMAG34_0320 [Candidatus Saccharibacteria bacterium]|nr:hypothetical protein LBMAG34_0320 [Candidatus Saccharibacteria bacterium]